VPPDNPPVDTIRRAALLGGLSMTLVEPLRAAAQVRPAGAGVRSTVSVAGAAGDGSADDSAAIRAALARHDTINQGAFTVAIEEGGYRLEGSGRALLTLQSGTRLLGGALEGTQLLVAPAADAAAVLSDDSQRAEGSAAKIELYNLTINGRGNPRLTAGFDLGTGRSVPFGTYGRLDNLLVRDAPNATAFNLSVNIVAIGDLYSLNTRDGLVTADGGSGCHVRAVYPYGWSRYGIRLGGIGDNVLNGEGEAPTSDDAVYIYGSRSFIVGLGSHLIAVGAGTTLKRPFVIDTVTVGDWALGPWQFVRSDRTHRFGDFDKPTYRGRASAIGANTLTDTSKNWELDELKGWAIKILAGPGADNWAEIASNTENTITLLSGSWTSTGPVVETTPAVGSTYAVAPALCKAQGGGFASSKVLTLAEAVVRSLFARVLRVGSLRVGPSNAAAEVRGILRADVMLDLGSVDPRVRIRRTVPLAGARPGNFVVVSAADLRAAGLGVEADAQQDQVIVWIENRGAQPVRAGAGKIGLLIVQAG